MTPEKIGSTGSARKKRRETLERADFENIIEKESGRKDRGRGDPDWPPKTLDQAIKFVVDWCGESNGTPKNGEILLGLIRDGEREKTENEAKALDHLNFIEDPKLSGVRVSVEGVVSSTSRAYMAPTEIEATYKVNEEDQTETYKIGPKSPLNLQMVCVSADKKFNRIKRIFSGERKGVIFNEKTFRTVYRIRVRPPVFTLEMRGDRVIDESGQEYKSHDIFICSDEKKNFHAGALINMIGAPLPSPATQQTTLLVTDVSFPDAVEGFDREKIINLQTHLMGKSIPDRVEWFLHNFERFGRVVERRNLALASVLTYFSPIWVTLGRERQRGWVISLMIGDTTTGKSLTMRKMIELFGAGMFVTAETATVVGLLGTTTQAEGGGGWFVDWGFMVLSDRGLIAVDGSHKLGSKQWAVMAESERSGVVTIAKAARASTYARTRQIRIANAVDRSADKFTTMPLREFLYPVQALDTIMDKTSIARLDLAVFADSQDVKAEAINKELKGDYDKHLDLLPEVLKWAWSSSPDVEFTSEAMSLLFDEATRLYNKFYDETVPLVSIDMKWKLARLSIALATLTLSTDDLKTITVEEGHVKRVVEFLEDEYTRISLNTLSKSTRHEIMTEDDVKRITEDAAQASRQGPDIIKDICMFIATQGRATKDQLMTKFSLADKNQLRPLISTLTNEGMLRVGRGFYPTGRMVEYCKLVATIAAITTVEIDVSKFSEETLPEFLDIKIQGGNQGNRGNNNGRDHEKPPPLLKQIIKLWKSHNTRLVKMIRPSSVKETNLLIRGHDEDYVIEQMPGKWWALTPKALKTLSEVEKDG